MPKLPSNGSEPSSLYLGGTKVSAAYLGGVKVWPREASFTPWLHPIRTNYYLGSRNNTLYVNSGLSCDEFTGIRIVLRMNNTGSKSSFIPMWGGYTEGSSVLDLKPNSCQSSIIIGCRCPAKRQ